MQQKPTAPDPILAAQKPAAAASSEPPAPATGPLTVPVSRLTLANKITILRILMIPAFVLFATYYIEAFHRGAAREWQRYTAISIFLLAVIGDGVDGYVARRLGQKSRLGTLLDPAADKLLLVSALILLSIDHGAAFEQLPLWFPVLVISRDLLLLGGALILQFMYGNFVARPRWVGKLATVCQMITIGWVLLKIHSPSFEYPLMAAGFFTFISTLWYLYDWVRAIAGHPRPHKITRPF